MILPSMSETKHHIVSCDVELDEATARVSQAFDYEFTGHTEFIVPEFTFPKEFNIGLIVGASGSGKSQLLKTRGKEEDIKWNFNKAIVSQFSSTDEAIEKLFAAGLSSVPSLCKPYHVLSNGEKFRAEMARRIKDNAIIDEFTSVVNRETAKSLSVSISKYIKKKNIRCVVFASCHSDIIDWLEPDWVFDTNTNTAHANELSFDNFPSLGSIEY